MGVNVFFAGVGITNYQAACRWYERLLGRPPDLLPNDIEAAWRFSDTAWMYIIVDADRAGNALMILIIDDLDQQVAALRERGFVPDKIEDVPATYRRAYFRDLDGNTIGFTQVVAAAG
jgi:catechol 2,3-dioxygenase-like lactoylglutathione lyase family enzyme